MEKILETVGLKLRRAGARLYAKGTEGMDEGVIDTCDIANIYYIFNCKARFGLWLWSRGMNLCRD